MDSPKGHDNLSLNGSGLHDIGEGRICNGVTKNTPTPLSPVAVRRPTPFSSGIKSRLLGPRRYSLSDISSPLNGTSSTRSDLNSLGAGPLLTSLNYKDNVSLYEETKSTGLAGRIVRYDEEAEKRKPLVQEKYNGVGLFPIVHLFKNQANSDHSPKRTFIRIGTPDRIKCLPPPSREISNRMLEEITKPSPLKLKKQLRQLDHKTENVLDALKEISRKRILAHEDYDIHQDQSKKIKTDELQKARTSKRLQDNDDLNQSLNTSATQSCKKICVYDEYAASRSSSDMAFKVKTVENSQNDRKKISAKRKTTSTITEDVNRSKQVKLVTTETQTEATATKDQPDIAEKETKPVKKPSPLRVFDAHPLENLRKNRLAALMGTIVGKDVFFQSQIHENSSDILPVSILSTSRRHHDPLTEKHVHFDVPDTTDLVTSPALIDTQSKPSENIDSSDISHKPTEVSSNLIPTASTLAVTFSVSPTKPITSVSPVVASPPLSTPSVSVTSLSTPKVGGFKFDLNQIAPSKTQLNAENPNITHPTPQFDIKSTSSSSLPTFNFGNVSAVTSFAENSINPSLNLSSKTANVPPSSGFGTTTNSQANSTGSMFGLTNTASTFSGETKSTGKLFGTTTIATTFGGSMTTPSFTIGKTTSATSAVLDTKSLFGMTTPTTATVSASFLTNIPATSVTPTLPKTTTSSTFGFGSQLAATTTSSGIPPFGFSASAPSKSSAFGTTATASTTAQSTFAFNAAATKTIATTTTPSNFAFGSGVSSTVDTTTQSTFGFGSGAITSAPSSTVAFGSKPSSGPSFGAVNATPTFGNGTSSSLTFGTPSGTSTAPGFQNTSFASSAPTNAPTFGASTTKPAFGSSGQTPSFPAGTVAQSFGSSTSTPMFGNATNGQPGIGSSSNVFGAKTKSSTFGTPTTASTTSLFGGAPTTAPVGVDQGTPSFGVTSANTSSFGGAPTTAPAGSHSTHSMFGASHAPSFGVKSDSNKNPTFTFGENKSSGFPPNFTNPASAPAFGSSSPNFGQSTAQASTAKPLFGQPATSTINPVFGQPNQQSLVTNAFAGGNKNTFGGVSSEFGSAPTGSSPFGSGATVTSTFGSTASSSFGAQPTAKDKSFSFGSSTTANQNNAPFAFGSNNINNSSGATKPSFSFTGGAASTPTFGAGNTTTLNTPAFGAAANTNAVAPSFGQGGGASVLPTFGGGRSFGGTNPAAVPSPTGVGMFNIGAGASAGRSRPLAKAVRRRT